MPVCGGWVTNRVNKPAVVGSAWRDPVDGGLPAQSGHLTDAHQTKSLERPLKAMTNGYFRPIPLKNSVLAAVQMPR
jgi:hypothetical protein